MRASVVIRAKNEARYIGEVLEAIFRQEGVDPFEVIVVDSGSTDGTLEIVRAFPVRLIEIPAETFTYGRALNIGFAEARAAYVASLSAHSTPVDGSWLANLVAAFDNPRVAAVVGRQYPRDNATFLDLLGMRLTGLMSDRPELREHDPRMSNANSAYRRSLVQRLPFDEQLAGAEDFVWAKAMQERGYLLAYEPRAGVYHSHGEPLGKHLRRLTSYGLTAFATALGFGGRGEKPDRRAGVVPEK